MSPDTVGLIGIAVLLILLLSKLPVAFAMTVVGLAGFIYLSGPQAGFSVLTRDIYEQFASYPLSVIPMFILMGTFAFASGISSRLFDMAYKWIGQYRGGLAMASAAACAAFGAICGSSAATTATMGKVALPEMKRFGYNDKLATGTIAASGMLGIMIPPSTIFLVYGILTEQSIGKLFISGVFPGILLCGLFCLTIIYVCWRNPKAGPPGPITTLKEKIFCLKGGIEALILFGLALGGLFLGWFSPTQAGAIGALGALIIGLARRELKWKVFIESAKDGLLTSCMVIFIIAGATIFGHFMAVSRIPFVLVDWIGNLGIPALGVVVIISFVFFIGGFFMDAMALVVLLIPIFFPLLKTFQVDLIWFGVMLVLLSGMGVITPPVGINVYVTKGISPQVPIETIFSGIWPFLFAMVVCFIILIFFPQIATFLPSFLSY